jgi:hypothetical protein
VPAAHRPHVGIPRLDGLRLPGGDGRLGRRAGEWEVWQTSLHNPDFSAYARDCGALGIRVTDRALLDDALAEASRMTALRWSK